MKLLPKLKSRFEALGSVFELELINGLNAEFKTTILDDFEKEVKDFEKKFSRFLIESEVGKFNKNVGEWTDVSPGLMDLLKKGLELKQATEGFFEIGVDQTLAEHGYGIWHGKKEISDFKFESNEKAQVKVNKSVDFGGFGKGLMLDWAKNYFTQFSGVCINAGGDFYIRGFNENGEFWKIYWENPLDITEVIGEVEIKKEIFLAASNGVRRRWKNKHHLINPNDYSIADEMAGVFVQGEKGYWTDGISTALFAMGYARARVWLEDRPEIAAMIVSPSGSIYKNPLFEGTLYF